MILDGIEGAPAMKSVYFVNSVKGQIKIPILKS